MFSELIEEAYTTLATMEPDNVRETISYDFDLAAAGGDISNRPRGLDRYELLAKRSEAERSRSDQHRAEPTA
jgi:hypothetical protein